MQVFGTSTISSSLYELKRIIDAFSAK